MKRRIARWLRMVAWRLDPPRPVWRSAPIGWDLAQSSGTVSNPDAVIVAWMRT